MAEQECMSSADAWDGWRTDGLRRWHNILVRSYAWQMAGVYVHVSVHVHVHMYGMVLRSMVGIATIATVALGYVATS